MFTFLYLWTQVYVFISDVQAQPGLLKVQAGLQALKAVSWPQAAAQCTTERCNERNELGERRGKKCDGMEHTSMSHGTQEIDMGSN